MVRVEFYGIPRQRAGVAAVDVDARDLREALRALSSINPRLAASCFDGDRLLGSYFANINGQRFTTDPDAVLESGDTLLILSADAGG